MNELKVSNRCLLFYFDETGHEEFADPNCPIFGLGGCAVLSMYAMRSLVNPWKEMKRDYFGSEDIRLHANESANLNQDQKEAIGKFFKENIFSRFYTTIRIDSKIPNEITTHKLVSESLLKRISIIASAWPCDSIAFIFEDAERTNSLVERHFGATITKRDDGTEVPLTKCFMKKNTGEIGLEISDFIIHTAGAQTKQNYLKGKGFPRKDYDCIFRTLPKKFVSAFEILNAEINRKTNT